MKIPSMVTHNHGGASSASKHKLAIESSSGPHLGCEMARRVAANGTCRVGATTCTSTTTASCNIRCKTSRGSLRWRTASKKAWRAGSEGGTERDTEPLRAPGGQHTQSGWPQGAVWMPMMAGGLQRQAARAFLTARASGWGEHNGSSIIWGRARWKIHAE